jgi:hypothetical protein
MGFVKVREGRRERLRRLVTVSFFLKALYSKHFTSRKVKEGKTAQAVFYKAMAAATLLNENSAQDCNREAKWDKIY